MDYGIELNAMLGLPRPCPVGYIQLLNGKFCLGTNEAGSADENGTDASGWSDIGPNAKNSFKTMDGVERVLRVRGVVAGVDGTLTDGCETTFMWSQARYNWAIAQGTDSWKAKAADYAMMQVSILTPTSFEIDVALNARGATMQHAAGDRIISGGGRFAEILQASDGNFVIYDTWLGNEGDPNAAIWATMAGHIRDAAPGNTPPVGWVPAS